MLTVNGHRNTLQSYIYISFFFFISSANDLPALPLGFTGRSRCTVLIGQPSSRSYSTTLDELSARNRIPATAVETVAPNQPWQWPIHTNIRHTSEPPENFSCLIKSSLETCPKHYSGRCKDSKEAGWWWMVPRSSETEGIWRVTAFSNTSRQGRSAAVNY